jgi:6-phosphogluconolactonase
MTYHPSRRNFIQALGLGIPGIFVADKLFGGLNMKSGPADRTLFVGTYTSGKSEGIYRCRFDPTSGALKVESVTKGVVNPSFLAIDRPRGRLFAVNEISDFEGKPSGSVTAFAIDKETRELQLLNRTSSLGADPCQLVVDDSGRYLLVANYSGGNVTVLPVSADGTLGEASDMVQHAGSGIHPRQKGPHAHSINLDAANMFAYAVDLGINKVMIYHLDKEKGNLHHVPHGEVELKPGAGPRHLAFHPDGLKAYVVNELDSTITFFAVDRSDGGLEARQTLSTLPKDYTGENSPADIHVAPSGKFVYASNRGHDSIVVCAVDGKSGELSTVQHQSTLGKWPRNFAIDPSGRFLLVANQRSDTIVVFNIDQEKGTLAPAGQKVDVPAPVCLFFL